MNESQIEKVKIVLYILNIVAKICFSIAIFILILSLIYILTGFAINFPSFVNKIMIFIMTWGIVPSLIAILIVVIGERIIRKKYNM
ncbi:MAG: hypothetical protein GX362_00565 [Methanosarcinaceae archaeon]|nr:hypothetical protein [Methanosarcinaceae archaeon]